VGVPTRSEGEWAFINTVVDLLSPTGKALIVLPLGVLFRDGGKVFRQFLVEKNWIEGIVSLPANQFLTTQIPVCMLLLNKDTERDFWGNPRKHGVFMVNAAEDFTKTGKLNHWDQDDAVNFWHAREDKPGYGGFVPVETLRSERNSYNLSINRYFSPIREKETLDPVSLAQEVQTIQGRLAARSEWLDGKPGEGGGLWTQAIAASAASSQIQENANEDSTQ
jgi:type I restriction enzyme M protein